MANAEDERATVNNAKEQFVESAPQTKDETSAPVVSGKYHLLDQTTICFYDKPSLKKHAKVPPPTPDYDIDYERPIVHKPAELSNINVGDLPKVSDNGVKFTIEAMGKILGYDEYEYDLIQFWFLDILTDCLWKAQDVFTFGENDQKLILEWVTAIFKLIADPVMNLSRKEFLAIFKTILMELQKHISKSGGNFPGTQFIDIHVQKFLDQKYSNASDSSSSEDDDSLSSDDSNKQYSVSTFSMKSYDTRKLTIQPEFDIQGHIEHLKKNNPVGNIIHAYSDELVPTESSIIGENDSIIPDYMYDSWVTNPVPFWLNQTPFRKLDYICGCQLSPSKIYCTCAHRYLMAGEDRDLDYQKLFMNPEHVMPYSRTETDSSTAITKINNLSNSNIISASVHAIDYLTTNKATITNQTPIEAEETNKTESDQQNINEENLEREKELEIMQEWAYFKLMQQRNFDMDDPRVGWIPWMSWLDDQEPSDTSRANFAERVEAFMTSRTNEPSIGESSSGEEYSAIDKQMNFNILKAIVDFVFEYFYENFHFTLIKLAFRCPPNLITQPINDTWNIPKVMKSEFKRPKESKPAKEPKSPKGKADKKSKASKKSDKSGKSKKSKKDKAAKGGKRDKGKKGKDKKSKKGKKDKDPKEKVKLTAEELEELERQRVEVERIEMEKQMNDENRVYMFPLADAASETLFLNIFENWVKVNQEDETGKKEKKDKKGKKGKKGKKKK